MVIQKTNVNWFKRHKIWTFTLIYFGLAILVGPLLPFDALLLGQYIGFFYWSMLFIYWIILKVLKR